MSFRGRGRGRGGFGGFGGRGGFRPVKQVPFELFPEIEGLGTAEYSTANRQLIKWSWELQKDRESSPYYYEDRSQPKKQQKLDIEKYSDRKVQVKDVKRPLWHFIKLGSDHMPAELADEKRRVKKVKWTSGRDMNKLDYFEKMEQQREGKEGTEKKENEEAEEEEEVIEEGDGEFSDEGDYEQAEDFDDDEDDFNMADDNDEPCY